MNSSVKCSSFSSFSPFPFLSSPYIGVRVIHDVITVHHVISGFQPLNIYPLFGITSGIVIQASSIVNHVSTFGHVVCPLNVQFAHHVNSISKWSSVSSAIQLLFTSADHLALS